MLIANWLVRYKYLRGSDKVLLFTGLLTVLLIIGSASWLAVLPAQTPQTRILPRYAALKNGIRRFPINLPEPAAGPSAADKPEKDSAAQNKVTLPITLPDKIPQTALAGGAGGAPSTQSIRAPLDRLTDDSGGLMLPIIGPDGTTPFDAYRSRFTLAEDDDRARIAVVVTGIGLNSRRSEKTYDALPSAISVAVSPYAQQAQNWVDKAFDQGRDVLLMVPMEPNSFPTVDPGPDTLMRDAPQQLNLERLHTVMSKMHGYCGIINDTGSRFTANELAVGPILDDVAKRGLMVVDARSSAYTVLASQAKKRGLPVAVNTRFVDSSLRPDDIDRQLRDLERTALTVGSAVGLVRAFPITLARLEAWLERLDNTEVVLTPISAVANTQPIR